jgi:hypothetical protein
MERKTDDQIKEFLDQVEGWLGVRWWVLTTIFGMTDQQVHELFRERVWNSK